MTTLVDGYYSVYGDVVVWSTYCYHSHFPFQRWCVLKREIPISDKARHGLYFNCLDCVYVCSNRNPRYVHVHTSLFGEDGLLFLSSTQKN